MRRGDGAARREERGAEEVGEVAGFPSHGNQKQLELGITLALEPKILLLDEPTAGMSAQETRESIRLIERIARERGLTLLFTEHDMEVVSPAHTASRCSTRARSSPTARLRKCAGTRKSAASTWESGGDGRAVTAAAVPPAILTRHRRCPRMGGRDMLGAGRASRSSSWEQLTARVPGGPTARADDLACGTPRQMLRDRSPGHAAYAIRQ